MRKLSIILLIISLLLFSVSCSTDSSESSQNNASQATNPEAAPSEDFGEETSPVDDYEKPTIERIEDSYANFTKLEKTSGSFTGPLALDYKDAYRINDFLYTCNGIEYKYELYGSSMRPFVPAEGNVFMLIYTSFANNTQAPKHISFFDNFNVVYNGEEMIPLDGPQVIQEFSQVLQFGDIGPASAQILPCCYIFEVPDYQYGTEVRVYFHYEENGQQYYCKDTFFRDRTL